MTTKELLACITDRPCDVCKFHGENGCSKWNCVFDEKPDDRTAIQALSQVSEIEENIIKYMKKYPNHVGNMDFWEGFYACRNVVLQLDDEEYSPKEQEPCDDAISRQAVLDIVNNPLNIRLDEIIKKLPSVTPSRHKGHWIKVGGMSYVNDKYQCSE